MTDEQLSHLLDDPLPEGIQPITDEIYANLARHFTTRQIMDISFTVGLDQLVSRFHATVQTDVDEVTTDQFKDSCPVPLPPPPGSAAPGP